MKYTSMFRNESFVKYTCAFVFVYIFLHLDEFHRAVKICTGTSMSPHLVDTVFAIFDVDGDGLLSYREFIAIMKDRLHRGFKASITTSALYRQQLCATKSCLIYHLTIVRSRITAMILCFNQLREKLRRIKLCYRVNCTYICHIFLQSYAKSEGWDAFKSCIKQEMKTPK